MPVTKTARRALRSSKRKEAINKQIRGSLEAAIRIAKKKKGMKNISAAISLVDRAAKKNLIHKNKAARIKSTLSKLLPRQAKGSKKPNAKKTSVKK